MIRRVMMPLLGAALATAVITASSFGLVSTLPQPTSSDRLGVRLLLHLERARGSGTVITIGRKTLRAHCRLLSPRRYLITLNNGQAMAMRGSHIRAWRGAASSLAPVRGRTTTLWLPSVQRREAAVRVAEADLAGSYRLYAVELAAKLATGDNIIAGTATVRGRTAYRVELARGRPEVELIVDRNSLRPLGARYRSARLRGASSFLGAAHDPGTGC